MLVSDLLRQVGEEGATCDAAEAQQCALAVYERGVSAVRMSADMWVAYIQFVETMGDEKRLGDILDRAVDAVGTCPDAGKVWGKCVEAAKRDENVAAVGNVFKRLLRTPFNGIDKFWEQFTESLADSGAEVLEGLWQDECSTEEVNADSSVEEIRSQVLIYMQQVYASTAAIVLERHKYESAINRPYFHVKPLGETQLAAWRAYLDFEEGRGDVRAIETLYERCVVAAANYSEFWLRYAAWKEAHMQAMGGFGSVAQVLARACDIFLKRRPEVHFARAEFLEVHGRVEGARMVHIHINR